MRSPRRVLGSSGRVPVRSATATRRLRMKSGPLLYSSQIDPELPGVADALDGNRVGSKKKRIIFVNRFFFPDHSATSQMVSDLAFHLAACGHDIQVITSQQLYEDARASLPEHELIDAVQIHRIPTTGFGGSGLSGRAVACVSCCSLRWCY